MARVARSTWPGGSRDHHEHGAYRFPPGHYRWQTRISVYTLQCRFNEPTTVLFRQVGQRYTRIRCEYQRRPHDVQNRLCGHTWAEIE